MKCSADFLPWSWAFHLLSGARESPATDLLQLLVAVILEEDFGGLCKLVGRDSEEGDRKSHSV